MQTFLWILSKRILRGISIEIDTRSDIKVNFYRATKKLKPLAAQNKTELGSISVVIRETQCFQCTHPFFLFTIVCQADGFLEEVAEAGDFALIINS